jgi:hypothetical protein
MPITAEQILSILGQDVDPNFFYTNFLESLEGSGVDTSEWDNDTVRLVSGLALLLTLHEQPKTSIRSLCAQYGFTEAKAHRVKRWFSGLCDTADFNYGTYVGGEWQVDVLQDEPKLSFLVKRVSSETKVEVVQEGPVQVIEAEGVKTLEELINTCGVNEEEWMVAEHRINKWDAMLPDGQGAQELFQVRARFVPRVLNKPAFPVIQPIQISPSYEKQTLHPTALPARALIVPDPQIGFKRDLRSGYLEPLHDRRAMDVVLQAAELFQPDRVVFLGDWLDLAEWSDKFLRSPEFAMTTQPSLAEGAWWLAQFRQALPGAQMDFLLGNHEARVQNKLFAHLEAAFNITRGGAEGPPLLSIENMLALDSLGIECHKPYPHGVVWLNEMVECKHGEVVRGQSGKTVEAVLKNSTTTQIFGHIHRLEYGSSLVHGKNGPQPIHAFSPGCLCRIDSAVPSSMSRMNWQQGFGLVDYDPQGTEHNIVPVRIFNGQALAVGYKILAREQDERIAQDTGWPLVRGK